METEYPEFDEGDAPDDVGEEHPIIRIYNEERERIFDFLMRMCADDGAAVQVLEESINALARDLKKPISDTDLRWKLYQTARNFSAHAWKNSTPNLLPPSQVKANSKEYIVQQILLKLPRHEKELVLLHGSLGFSWDDVAHVLELSLGDIQIKNAVKIYEKIALQSELELNDLYVMLQHMKLYSTPAATQYVTRAVSQQISGIIRTRHSRVKNLKLRVFFFAVLLFGGLLAYTEYSPEGLAKIIDFLKASIQWK